MQSQRALDVPKMLAQLSRHVRVKLAECLESQPQFKCRQLKLSEHLLHAEVVDVFAVKVDDACVD